MPRVCLPTNNSPMLSVVIPAKNEAASIGGVVSGIKSMFPSAEIIVVDDGSTDDTGNSAESAGAVVVHHPYSKGNGAAIKSGATAASGDIVIFMDGDGQHRPEDISRLLALMDQGYDMVVGARTHAGQAGWHRSLANRLYNRLASWMVGHQILDLTSGFRAVQRKKFLQFLYLLPNGFSYPTTITMAFFRAGYSIAYVPIAVRRRDAGTKSHINLWRDGLRFFLIIFKVGTLYSPLKLFVPVAMLHFLLGIGYYAYTYFSMDRLSIATIFMLTAAVSIFMIGLVSEQITALMYKDGND